MGNVLQPSDEWTGYKLLPTAHLVLENAVDVNGFLYDFVHVGMCSTINLQRYIIFSKDVMEKEIFYSF
jgi:hypothetical protein